MTNLAFNPSILRLIPLFSRLSEEQLAAIYPWLQHRHYPENAVIFDAGTPPEGLYALLAGHAKVFIANERGNEVTLATIGPSEFFGETGALDGLSWSAGVKALERCEIVYIPRSAFLRMLEGRFDVAMVLLASVIRRLREAERKIEILALMDVYGRVAHLLVESARNVNGRWIVETGSEEIARMAGASREMVSRVVKDMARKGLIRREKRKTLILDRVCLAAEAAAPRSRGGSPQRIPAPAPSGSAGSCAALDRQRSVERAKTATSMTKEPHRRAVPRRPNLSA